MKKCWVVGEQRCGKTTLIRALAGQHGNSVEIVDRGSRTRLQFALEEKNDLGGNIESVECLLLLYDTTSVSSFRIVHKLSDFRPRTALVLVGTKVDKREMREVDIEAAESLAIALNCPHIEVSSTRFTSLNLLLSLVRIQTLHYSHMIKPPFMAASQSLPDLPASLLTLEVKLTASTTVSVSVFEGDSALDLARRVLAGWSVSSQEIWTLSGRIQTRVEEYCGKLSLKPLYKVKVSYGEEYGEVVVREGDDLRTLASDFCRIHSLPVGVELSIYSLLESAYTDYTTQKRIMSSSATCVA